MSPKTTKLRRRVVSFFFGCLEPGEVATVGCKSAEALRPRYAHISPSNFTRGVTFDALLVEGQVVAVEPDVANPTRFFAHDVPGGTEVSLRLRNEGELAVHCPVVIVVFDVLEKKC